MFKLIVFACLLLLTNVARSQDFSNKGKDFWIGYGNHVRMFDTQNQAEQMQVYMTSDVSTTGTLSIPGINVNMPFTVTANQITTLDIPRAAALRDEGIYNLGIHVTAQQPIVVYSFIYVNAISGATLCLPVSTLGKDYYSVNYTQISNSKDSYSYFDVIATDTGITTVEIIPSKNTKGGHLAGIPYSVLLKQGEVYQVLGALTSNVNVPYTGVDLTGSQIRSVSSGSTGCKKIAVFCGSGKISIGCAAAGTSDNLYQQMYPVSTWGKAYITVPSINRNSTRNQINFYRIFTSVATAVVKVNGAVIPSASFINNQYYEFSGSESNYIESDKPMLVVQYFTTSSLCAGNSGQGDPEMIYLNPVEQTISRVTLNAMQPPLTNSNINEHYLNVVLKNRPEAINTFKIDGAKAGTFTPLTANSAYAYAQITVSSGTHTLTCDSGFNAISYGFGSAESYGYSAGTNLKDLYQFVSIQNEYAVVNFPAGCNGSPFRFSIVLPYLTASVKWQFKGLFTDTTVFSPVYDSMWTVNGKTLYRYKLDKPYVINKSATYPITIIADNLTADGCSGEQQIDYDLQIFDRPKAAFTSAQGTCISDPVNFRDTTVSNGRPLIGWLWNFGDGSASVQNNPSHTYKKAGTFGVSYSVITDIGCLSDTAKRNLVFEDQPVAKFSADSLLCEDKLIQFNNLSAPVGSGSVKWSWDFGDGTTTTVQQPRHMYDTAGSYLVKLLVENATGCKSTSSLPLLVHFRPQPFFSIPEVCSIDPFARFLDSSVIGDRSEATFSYLWNFGDQNASPSNLNTSSVKNPAHTYIATGSYQVMLQVKSADGCTADTSRPFFVNGAKPVADFDVSGTSRLCSDSAVTIRNISVVMPGSITKLDIYWDYTRDPLLKMTDETPSFGKLYPHTYGRTGTQDSTTYRVLFVAYSGINCFQQMVKDITVYATPVVAFGQIPPVCEEAAALRITTARETSTIAGTGAFSGPGIAANGVFTPKTAGPGVHTLRYTFTGSKGCTAFADQTIQVKPSPLADAGPDRTILEGGSVTLAAKAAANSTYLWTPNIAITNNTVLTPVITTMEDRTYLLTVISADGCMNSDAVGVKVLKAVKVPNAFSPNGDGINDTWHIDYLDSYPGASIQVFNRYGQLVFGSTGYNRDWDGTHNGASLPTGTYYWIIDPKNGRSQMNGSVTIIR